MGTFNGKVACFLQRGGALSRLVRRNCFTYLAFTFCCQIATDFEVFFFFSTKTNKTCTVHAFAGTTWGQLKNHQSPELL